MNEIINQVRGIFTSHIVWLLLVTAIFGLTGCGDTEEEVPLASQATPTTEETANPSGLAAADVNGDGIVYRSGMHPWIIEDEPGQCPICGMDLVATPVDQVEEGVVRIDPVTLQNIGVRTAVVSVEPLQRSVRTTGRFEANEQAFTAVSPKIEGWVEQLFVNYEGARVSKGQPLLSIYSPELVSTQEEYLLALRHAEQLGGGPDSQRLIDAARRRLSYWDISNDQIEQLEETRQLQRTLTLFSPANGTVVKKDVVEGQKITPGMTLFELADLSRIWLMVDVYEQDLAWINTGTLAKIELPYQPGQSLSGRVDYIYDTLDPMTRTVKARLTLPNPGLDLKPGMYATVTLTGGQTQEYPVVPSEALIRSGERSIVILSLGEGRFMPAEVRSGVESDGYVQILSGLQGGEEVVTSAQFLIDSEARLQSAVGAMVAGHDHGTASHPGTAEPKAAAPGHHTMSASEHTATPSAAAGEAQVIHITVGKAGYTPSEIKLEPGIPARLVFIRTENGGCTDQIQIPAFGIEPTPLPLNTAVTFEITPEKSSTFKFACGMDMVTGTVVVQS